MLELIRIFNENNTNFQQVYFSEYDYKEEETYFIDYRTMQFLKFNLDGKDCGYISHLAKNISDLYFCDCLDRYNGESNYKLSIECGDLYIVDLFYCLEYELDKISNIDYKDFVKWFNDFIFNIQFDEETKEELEKFNSRMIKKGFIAGCKKIATIERKNNYEVVEIYYNTKNNYIYEVDNDYNTKNYYAGALSKDKIDILQAYFQNNKIMFQLLLDNDIEVTLEG